MALGDNLVSYWTLNETSGTTLADKVGSNSLTTSNSPTLGNAGKIGNCLTFTTGANRNARKTSAVGISSLCGTSPTGTINFWVNPQSGSTGIYGLFGISDGSSRSNGHERQFGMHYNTSSDVRLFYNTGLDPGHFTYLNDFTLPLNTWTMVTLVYSGSDVIALYKNGSLYTGAVQDSSPNLASISSPIITAGYSDDTSFYTGMQNFKIDCVGIWSDAKNSTDISSLYNSGAGNESFLVNTQSFTKTGVSRILIQDLQQVYDGEARLKITGNQITKTGDSKVYVGTISGNVQYAGSPVNGAKIMVLQSDDQDMTNLELLEIATTDINGDWSSHIDLNKVGWAIAYYTDGANKYRSKAHGFFEGQ